MHKVCTVYTNMCKTERQVAELKMKRGQCQSNWCIDWQYLLKVRVTHSPAGHLGFYQVEMNIGFDGFSVGTA